MATLVSGVKKAEKPNIEEVTTLTCVGTANENANWYRNLENILTISQVVIYRFATRHSNFTASYLLIASIIITTW